MKTSTAILIGLLAFTFSANTLRAYEWDTSELSWPPGAVQAGWHGWWFRSGTEWFQFTFSDIDTSLIDSSVTVRFNLSVTNRMSGEGGLDGLVDVVINPGMTPTATYTDVLFDNVDPNNVVQPFYTSGAYETFGRIGVPKGYIIDGQLIVRVLRHPDANQAPAAPVGTEQPIDMSTSPPTVPPGVYEDDDPHTVHIGVHCLDGAGGHIVTCEGGHRCVSVISDLAPEEDCNTNGIWDACDIDCGTAGGPCDVPGCGQSDDRNANGVPDECEDLLVLYPTDDARIEMRVPDGNYGSSTELRTRNRYGHPTHEDNWEIDTLLRFDLSSVPLGRNVSSATVHAYYFEFTRHHPEPEGRELTCHRITSDWDEETVTWNNQPTYAAEATSSATIPEGVRRWMVWDVTGDVQAILSDPGVTNHGWEIRDDVFWGTYNIPTAKLSSKEFGAPWRSAGPILLVTLAAEDEYNCDALGAYSCCDHAAAGRMCLALGARGAIEPRAGGTTELDIDLEDASGFAGGVSVTCANAGDISDNVSGVSVNSNTVTVTFSPALPDQDACMIELDCGVEVCVRGLEGDSDRDGGVTTADGSAITQRLGMPLDTGNFWYDMDADGSITTADGSSVTQRSGNVAPSCP